MSKVTVVRQQESELPAAVDIQFINIDADYQQGSQQSRRTSTLSIQKVNVNTPIVFTDHQARDIADKLMYNVWTERDRMTVEVTRKYAYLEPTDVFTIVDAETGYAYLVRIVKRTESRSGAISLECVADFSPVYDEQNVPTTTVIVVAQVSRQSSASVAVFMDLPVLREVDAGVGFYLPMAGTTDVWGGGAVYRSIDGGANYALYETAQNPATIGNTLGRLGEAHTTDAGFPADASNSIFVTLDTGELASSNPTAVTAGANLIAVAAGDGWELLQFTYATLQTPVGGETRDTYKLTGLVRGKFGTEWAMGLHASGDKLVLIDTASVQRTHLTNAEIGVGILYKALTVGQPLGAVAATTVTNAGVALKPYSPVNLTGLGAPSNIVLTWDRRLRVGESATEPQLYEVEIWNTAYTSLKRTFTGLTSPTVTYTTTQQTADFGGVQDNIAFKVFQVSPIAGIGRGYEARGLSEFIANGTTYTSAVTEVATAAATCTGTTSAGSSFSVSITEVADAIDTVRYLGAGTISAPNIFVATTGSDANTGRSSGSPFLTIAHASAVAVPGDIISVADGNYLGNLNLTTDGTIGAPITFVSATLWGAKIKPGTSSSSAIGWDSFGDYTIIDGFEVDGSVDPTTGTRWRVGLRTNGEGSIVRNCHVHDIDRNGTYTSSGGAGILLDSQATGNNQKAYGNKVHHVGPLSGSNAHHGIYVTSSGEVKNNITYANTGGGIYLWHDVRHVDVTNNTSFNNVEWGIVYGGGDYVNLTSPCDYITVTNNICYSNGVGIRELGDLGAHNVVSHNLCNANTTNYSMVVTSHTDDVIGNPLFLNYQADGSGDYHLQAGSPARNVGTATYAPSTDYDGAVRPAGAGFDLGAYERG